MKKKKQKKTNECALDQRRKAHHLLHPRRNAQPKQTESSYFLRRNLSENVTGRTLDTSYQIYMLFSGHCHGVISYLLFIASAKVASMGCMQEGDRWPFAYEGYSLARLIKYVCTYIYASIECSMISVGDLILFVQQAESA